MADLDELPTGILVPKHAVRRPSGEFIEQDESGKVLREGNTLTCCHCGYMWEVIPGSGRVRGWCRFCGQVTCGAAACLPCMPYERKLEALEAAARRRA